MIKVGWSNLQTGNYDVAIQDFLKALQCIDSAEKSSLQEIYRGLGWAYYHKNGYEEAIKYFNKVLENNLSDAPVILQDVFRGLGWSYFRKKNFNAAIGSFNSALKNIDPSDKDVMQEAHRGLDLACQMKRDKGVYDSSFYEAKSIHINTNTPFTELGPPEIIEIEPTFACNLRCIQCHVSYKNLPGTMIDSKFLKHLTKELKGKWVVLGSNYEPMVHPEFSDIVLAFSDLGLKINLITNGTLLTEALSNQLANCNFFNVIISFDGIRKKTYESIRRNANYERAIERILYFKNRVANEKTYFAINNTLMKRNIDEVVEAVDFWEKHGFDHMGIIIMAMRDLNEILKQESLENMMDYVYKKLAEAAKQVIENNYKLTLSGAGLKDLPELKAIYPSNFVGSCVKSNNHLARTPFNPGEFIQNGYYPGMPVKCRSPFKSARILYNGNVELCYQFPIGNIYNDDFLDIWYGEKAQNVRKQLMSDSKICHSCDYYRLCIKAGELDYNDADSFYSELVHKKYRYPEIIEKFMSYNIVAWLDDYYAIPRSFGRIDILSDNVKELKGVFVDKSMDKIKEVIRRFIEGERTKDHFVLRRRGWLHLQKGNYDAAIQDLGKALACIDPGEKDALQEVLRGLGWSYFHNNCFDDALQSFLRAVENTALSNKDILQDLFRGIGWVYIKKNNFLEAKHYFNKAIENIEPNSLVTLEDAKKGLDIADKALGKVSRDFNQKNNVVENPPQDLPKNESTGSISNQTSSVAELKESLRSSVLSEMGWVYYLKANYTEALHTFNKALSLNSNNQSALRGRGWTFLQKYKFKEALDDFNKALNNKATLLRTNLQEVFRGRGWAQYNCGNFKEAINDFTVALENKNSDDYHTLNNIYKGRSWAFYKLGNSECAINDFRNTNKFFQRSLYLAKLFLKVQITGSAIKREIRYL